jgi:hypothetical protein
MYSKYWEKEIEDKNKVAEKVHFDHKFPFLFRKFNPYDGKRQEPAY